MIDINPDYMVYAALAAEAYRTTILYTTPSLILSYVKEKIMPKNDLEEKIDRS